uniref:Uncharacterized protein n=1 Tax=Glossina pallidipes TaxID=7398 RepID=A0A1B0A364_GLOPL
MNHLPFGLCYNSPHYVGNEPDYIFSDNTSGGPDVYNSCCLLLDRHNPNKMGLFGNHNRVQSGLVGHNGDRHCCWYSSWPGHSFPVGKMALTFPSKLRKRTVERDYFSGIPLTSIYILIAINGQHKSLLVPYINDNVNQDGCGPDNLSKIDNDVPFPSFRLVILIFTYVICIQSLILVLSLIAVKPNTLLKKTVSYGQMDLDNVCESMSSPIDYMPITESILVALLVRNLLSEIQSDVLYVKLETELEDAITLKKSSAGSAMNVGIDTKID